MSLSEYIPPPTARQTQASNAAAIAAFKTDKDRQLEAIAFDCRLEAVEIQSHFLAIGRKLNEAKALLRYGEFGDWFDRQNFPFARSSAASMMMVAQSDVVLDPDFADLPTTALTALSKPTTPPAAIAAARALIKRKGGPDNVRAGDIVDICMSFAHDEKVALAEITRTRKPRRRPLIIEHELAVDPDAPRILEAIDESIGERLARRAIDAVAILDQVAAEAAEAGISLADLLSPDRKFGRRPVKLAELVSLKSQHHA